MRNQRSPQMPADLLPIGKFCCGLAWVVTAIQWSQPDPHAFPSAWWLQVGVILAFVAALLGVIVGTAEGRHGLTLWSIAAIFVLSEALDPWGVRFL